MPVVSLTDLQQQITQRERELQSLRRELESRRNQVTELTRRKEQLQRRLQQVEKEITALADTTPATTKQSQSMASPSSSVTPRVPDQPRLFELIVLMLREGGRPMTARQLSAEAQRRGLQPAGRDPVKSVKARLQELKNKGVVWRASGQPGYILAPTTNGARKPNSKPTAPAQTGVPKTSAKPTPLESAPNKQRTKESSSTGAVRKAKSGSRGGQPSLRLVLMDILKSSRKPLSGAELAERALAAGYKTEARKFVDSIFAMLGQMDTVEHLPQKGYRLKKT
jgi:hypothetical protein